MINFKSNKKTKAILLIFLTFTPIIANLNIGILYSNDSTKNQDNADSFSNENVIDFQDKLPETSQIQTYSGDGEDLNVILHQSIVNSSLIDFTNLDTTNTFTEPFPDFPGYNSSFINVSINSIYAPDKDIIVETGISSLSSIAFTDWAFSFEVRGNGILDNFSMCFTENHPFVRNASIDVYLYDAIWDSSSMSMKPDSYLADLALSYQIDDGSIAVWYNFTNLNQNLNIANTDNNTFFIYFHQNTINTQANVRFHHENDLFSGLDDSKAWEDLGGPSWLLTAIDPSLKIYLTPLSNTPLPSQVSLKVNGSDVTDISNQQGYWSSSTEYDSPSDLLEFNITAEWWDVSCDVTEVQINFTKSDLMADSDFTISGSGQTVQWNVTVSGGLNYFDSRLSDHNTINFTIPSNWDDATIEVFNGSIDKTTDSMNRLISSEYREVKVSNVGNGTYWHLKVNSTNLLSDIMAYVGGVEPLVANFSNVIEFNATFSEVVSDGILNLSVYSRKSVV